MFSFKDSFYSQVIHFCSQNIYRLYKEMSLTLALPVHDIAGLSTAFGEPYNNNNIN
jgi:hypothetical protein